MARTRQKRSQGAGNTPAGAGGGSQQQLPVAFVTTTIVPFLRTYQQQCLTQYAAVTGLIAQITFGIGSSVQTPMPGNATALGDIGSLIGTPDVLAATQGLGGSAPTGSVDEGTTIDAYIFREIMSNPAWASGFTSQKMRQYLQDKIGANRTTPIKQNHVTNALRKHWEGNRLLAVGGNPLAKEQVKQWFPANVANPPAGAYTLQMAQSLAGQQAAAE